LLFNYGLECAVRKFQENQEGLELNRTHHILIYAYSFNVLDENINIRKKNAEDLWGGWSRRKLSTCLCVAIKIQDSITIY
jgi:hypothetical protein